MREKSSLDRKSPSSSESTSSVDTKTIKAKKRGLSKPNRKSQRKDSITKRKKSMAHYKLIDPDEYQILEVKDFEGNWYSAMIKSIKDFDNKVRVGFEGWVEDNNEWIDIDARDKFRPHRGMYSKKGPDKRYLFKREGDAIYYIENKKKHILSPANLVALES